MMKARLSRPLVALLALGSFSAAAVSDENWPGFLGPQRDGASNDTRLVDAWLSSGLNQLWRVPIGEGYSGLAVSDGRVFTMDSDGQDEFVLALNAHNGRELWRVRLGRSPRDVYGGLGPRMTPTVDGDLLFVGAANGDFLALETENGKLRWRRNLASEHGWRPPAEGTASSPLAAGNQVIVMIGGGTGKAAAALDRASGRTLWIGGDGRVSYSSPALVQLGGRPQILLLMAARLIALDPDGGAPLWSHPWETYDGVNVAVPLVPPGGSQVFLSAGYDQGALLLQIEPADRNFDVRPIWRNREMKNHFNNSVYHAGTFFGFDNATFKAIDAADGRTLWRERGFGQGSLIRVGEHLVVLGERGTLSLVEAGRQSCVVRAQIPVLRGRCWTPPSLAGARLYLRNQKEVVCLGDH